MNLNQQYAEKAIRKNWGTVMSACKIPVCSDDESAEKVRKGMLAIGQMEKEELVKLNSLPFDEISKSWDKSEVRAFAYHVGQAMGTLQDAFLGVLGKNALQQSMIKKTFHSEGFRDGSEVRVVDSSIQNMEGANVDMGWTISFTTQDVRNFAKMKVIDFVSATRFMQYKSASDDIEAQALGSYSSGEIDPEFFAAAFRYSDYDMRFSAVTLNQILNSMRLSAATNISLAAYRCLADNNGGETFNPIAKYAPTGSDEIADDKLEILKARATLNKVHYDMIERANPSVNPKKRNSENEAGLSVSANSPIIFYYNHQHREFFSKVQSMTGGDDGINLRLLDNWVMVPSMLMPKSGGHTITNADGPERDAHGFFGTIKEIGPVSQVGGTAIIPGLRNQYGIFRGLSFMNATDSIKESSTVAAKQFYKFAKDKRQHAYVKLK